jgi:hypothetical protein
MTKKSWTKPEVKRIAAGSAENGSPTPANGDTQSTGTKS